MKDGNNIQWENDSVINVVELDKTTHTLSVDCTQENFTLTFEGLDNGNTELAISNVTAFSSDISSTTTPTTTTLSTTKSSSSVSTSSTSSHSSTTVSLYADKTQ